jgi:hypothetical protein
VSGPEIANHSKRFAREKRREWKLPGKFKGRLRAPFLMRNRQNVSRAKHFFRKPLIALTVTG